MLPNNIYAKNFLLIGESQYGWNTSLQSILLLDIIVQNSMVSLESCLQA